MPYSKQQVYNETLKYFNNDQLPTNVWIDKYCLKNDKGEYLELTPDDMHNRLADEFSRIEEKYPNPVSRDKIYNLLKSFKYFIPAGSPMYGIGNNESIISISNCFFIGNHGDSYGSIMRMDQEAVQLYKRRGGCGIDISHLRPLGSSVSNSAGSSTGAVSFMNRYSESARECGQNGRRAALMISLDVSHPDIEKFITSKEDLTKITGANISVKLDDEFMKAVESHSEYILKFKDIKLNVNATKLWDKLVTQMFNKGEPGFLYWSNIQKESPSDCYKDFKVKGVNPCSEITLSESECCRLGHMNLSSFVKNEFTDTAYFDFKLFKNKVIQSYRLMDNLVDLDIEKIDIIISKIKEDKEDPLTKAIELKLWQDIKDKTIRGRRIGLGYTALADTMAMLGIKYSSKEAIEFAKDITEVLASASYECSINLALERGSFPEWNFDTEKNNPFLKRIYERLKDDSWFQYQKVGRRNITSLTLAPTGSVSLMAGNTSSGIEPVYQLSYKRRRKVDKDHPNISFTDKKGDCWEEYEVLHPNFLKWYTWWNWKDSDYIHKGTLLDGEIQWNYRSPDEKIEIIKQSPYFNSTALEINPLHKVEIIAACQQFIDAAISNTLNFKANATKENMSEAAIMAWKLGCKGFTAYKEGSRDGVLISNDSKSDTKFEYHSSPKRPKILDAVLHTTKIKGNNYAIVIGLMEDKPYEIFCIPNFEHYGSTINGTITKVKKGNFKFESEHLDLEYINERGEISERRMNILLSGILRHGAHPKYLTKWIDKSNWDITAYANAVKRIIRKYIPNEEFDSDKCPECGQHTLKHESGCLQCINPECGYTACG